MVNAMELLQNWRGMDQQNALRAAQMEQMQMQGQREAAMHPLQIQAAQMNMLAKRQAMQQDEMRRNALQQYGATGNINALAMGDPEAAAKIRMMQERGNMLANRPRPAVPWQTKETENGLIQVNPLTGETRIVKGPDGQPVTGKKIEKALPGSAVKELAGAGSQIEDTRRLAGSFSPEFGGKTILGDFSNTYKRIMGDETGQAQWWQDMDMLQNRTRHELFGSALTATELAAWNKTSVTPRMDADEIQKNLNRRQEIEARAASKLARAYAAGGYNKEQIKELLGTGAQYLEAGAPPVADGGKSGNTGGASGGWDDSKESRYQELLRKRNAAK